jgi:hypothetical protein
MDKYLLTLQEINDIPKFSEHWQAPTLEVERYLLLRGIKPFKLHNGGTYIFKADIGRGKDLSAFRYPDKNNVVKPLRKQSLRLEINLFLFRIKKIRKYILMYHKWWVFVGNEVRNNNKL